RTITTLQDEINQRYLIQSMNRRGSDQQSEASASIRSSNSTGSDRIQYSNISSTIWTHFKEVFDQERNARNLTFDEMCNRIEVCIQDLGGKIKTATIKNFYNNSTSCKSSTLNDIGRWLDNIE
ncbi:11759_t:CDS:1, partial [Gigaspora rosea]